MSRVRASLHGWIAGAAAVTALLASGVSPAVSATTSSARARTPGTIYRAIRNWYDVNIGGDVQNVNTHRAVLTPHAFVRSGPCPPHPLAFTVAQVIAFGPRGWYEESCTRDPNGKFDIATMSRKGAAKPAIAHDVLTPPLYAEGAAAAQSVEIAAAEHGRASKIVIDFSPAQRRSEADIFYRRGAVVQPARRQLKELVIRQSGRTVTHRLAWYR